MREVGLSPKNRRELGGDENILCLVCNEVNEGIHIANGCVLP